MEYLPKTNYFILKWRKEEKQKIEAYIEEVKSEICFLRSAEPTIEIREIIQDKMTEAKFMVDQFISTYY